MNKIKRVVIFGGVHGNELTGIYLVKKFDRSPHLVVRSTFKTITLLGNPKAFAIGRRYVDTDLNRCFLRRDLENPNLSSYEAKRAKEIYQILSFQNSQQSDLIIDIHSTTSNMGLTVICASNRPENLQIVAHLTSLYPNIKILTPVSENRDSPVLRSLSEFGFTVEVGPVAQGVIDSSLFCQTEELVSAILDAAEAYNLGKIFPVKNPLTVYQSIGAIDYPRNENGEIEAAIHPQLQFRDYEPLNPGSPMFLTFDGESLLYEGQSTVYPVFINEAAYYEKGIAMCFTQQSVIK